MTDIGKGAVEPDDRNGDRFFVSAVLRWMRGLALQVPVPVAGGGYATQRTSCGRRGFLKGLSPSHLLSPLPIALPQDWTGVVDTPLTGRELAKVRKKIVRQTGESGGLAP